MSRWTQYDSVILNKHMLIFVIIFNIIFRMNIDYQLALKESGTIVILNSILLETIQLVNFYFIIIFIVIYTSTFRVIGEVSLVLSLVVIYNLLVHVLKAMINLNHLLTHQTLGQLNHHIDLYYLSF